MKKNALLTIALLSMLLSSCGGAKTSDSSDNSFSSDSNTSETTSENDVNKLSAPTLELNQEKNGLVWNSIENATGYEIQVNNEEPVSVTSYLFSEVAGNYSIKVRAIGNGINYETSDYSNPFVYESKQVSIDKLSNNNGAVTLTGVAAKDLYVMEGESSYTKISNDTTTYQTNSSTNVAFKAVGGYDEDNNIYYFGDDAVKSIYATHLADPYRPYVIEDGDDKGGELSDTDLQDKYDITKYSNDWVPSTATLNYNSDNSGITPNKCVKLEYYRHSAYFKYSYDINPALTDGYNSITLYAKGDDVSTLTLALVAGEGAYQGVYISYSITAVPSVWTKYTIRMDDENWKINYGGGTITQAQAREITGYSSMAEMMPVFTTFDFRVLAEADANWSKTYMYLDEVQLEVTDEQTKRETYFSLSKNYCGKNETCLARVDVNGESAVAHVTVGTNNTSIPMNITKDGNMVTFTSSEDNGASLVYKAKASKGGTVLTYESATGAYAEYVNNLDLNSFAVLNDFESYEETGVGYDQSHSEASKSGLRGDYYCDYYSGASGSQMGGNGWSLMGSTDYLGLDKSHAHSGSQSVQIKAPTSNVCRYTSYDVYTGEALPMASGDTFSFFARNMNTYNTPVKVRVYYVNKVTPTNHVSTDKTVSDVVTIDIPANTDWTEYTMTINTKYSVYGYNFTTQAHSGLTYIQLDDISIYNSACSPWSI